MTDNIYVYYTELPEGINEAVFSCLDGFTVYLDPRQSEDGLKRSYEHALKHIRNGDFFRADVQEIESQAHRKE